MMVSRRSGPPGGIILILLLFIQGIYGKSLVGPTLDDGGEASSIGIYGKILVGPTLDDGGEASYIEARHDDEEGREISLNKTIITEARHDDEEGREVSLNKTIITGRKIRRSTGDTGDEWNSRMKTAVVTITGAIPPIGGFPIGTIISLFIDLFWPESQPDIWSLIKDKVEGLVDQKILEFELQERKNEILAIKSTLKKYASGQVREKGSLISTLIHACNELFVKLTESSNSVQLIPLVATHSTLHLLILKERLLHGKEMYDEDNTAVWRKELEDEISTYKNYIKDIYTKWVEWRFSKIIVKLESIQKPRRTPAYYHSLEVNDEMGTDSVKFSEKTDRNVQDMFMHLGDMVRDKIFRPLNGKMLQVLVPTFYLDNFIPGNEDNPSVTPAAMSIASFGPISPKLHGAGTLQFLYLPDNDNTGGGNVTSINIREANKQSLFDGLMEWGYIESFQVIYSTGVGQIIGGSSGSKLHQIPLDNRRVKSIQFCYDEFGYNYVTIGFSNGNSTGRLGSLGLGLLRCVDTGGIDTYGLYNIRAADSHRVEIHRYHERKLFQIELEYKAYPVRPSELHK